MTESLKLAKKFARSKDWSNAIKFYNEYLSKESNRDNIEIWVDYAKCLRAKGGIKEAKSILLESNKNFPNNKLVLEELYKLYRATRDWDYAEKIVTELVKIEPDNPRYHFLMGRVNSFLGNKRNTIKSYIRGLELRHNKSIKQIINEIQDRITPNKKDVHSEYVYVGGKNNLGAIIHNHKNKKYYTKIIASKNNSKKEKMFYQKIYREYPTLKNIVPKYIDSVVIDNILYLTIEKIDIIPNKDISSVIEASRIITSINYNDISNNFKNPKY